MQCLLLLLHREAARARKAENIRQQRVHRAHLLKDQLSAMSAHQARLQAAHLFHIRYECFPHQASIRLSGKPTLSLLCFSSASDATHVIASNSTAAIASVQHNATQTCSTCLQTASGSRAVVAPAICPQLKMAVLMHDPQSSNVFFGGWPEQDVLQAVHRA